MSIGKRIKEFRVALHMTAIELGKELDIPVRTIGSYERNEAQPGAKFFSKLVERYHVNINWLLSGKGNMFTSAKKAELDMTYISNLQDRLSLSNDEIDGLIDLLDCAASRDMILKFIAIKRGNKEALDTLIYNLQGIKAIYG